MISEDYVRSAAERRRTARCKGCKYRKSDAGCIFCAHLLMTGRSRFRLADGSRVHYGPDDPCPNWTPSRRGRKPKKAQKEDA